MSQALIISDDEVLNSLYSLNLEVYVATNVTVKKDIEEAKKLIELNPNFNFIITLSQLGETDSARDIYDFLQENDYKIPLIIIGKRDDFLNDVHVCPGSFNMQNIVRTAAKILEVTAKDMVEIPVPDYYPIPIKVFMTMEVSSWNVYIKVGGPEDEKPYHRIFKKGDKGIESKIKKFLEQDIEYLYIDSSYRLEMVNLASDVLIKTLADPNLSEEEQLDGIEQGIELVSEKLFTDKKASEQVINLSNSCIQTVDNVIKKHSKLQGLLKSLVENKTRYVYSHSIVAGFVANHIVKTISWGGDSHTDKLNFVFFFHDMFLVPLYNKYPDLKYEEDMLFSDKLSEKEKDIVLNHAKIASEVVQTFPRCPLGADAIIAQHHGATNGIGFAVKFKDDISPLARVIMVAESFVEEMFREIDEKGSFDKERILDDLYKKYKRATYLKLVDTLTELEL